jgi:hypothetical protein
MLSGPAFLNNYEAADLVFFYNLVTSILLRLYCVPNYFRWLQLQEPFLNVVYFIAEWLAKFQSWIQQSNVMWVD